MRIAKRATVPSSTFLFYLLKIYIFIANFHNFATSNTRLLDIVQRDKAQSLATTANFKV